MNPSMPGYSPGAVADEQLSGHMLDLTVRELDGACVLSVGGQADLHTAPDLRARLDELIDADERRIVVDLTETSFIDSMSLGVLLSARKRLAAAEGVLAVCCPDDHLRRVFEITSLQDVLRVERTLDAAIDCARRPNRL